MTESEIKRLAVQCGLPIADGEALKAFAKSVAAYWIERCAVVSDERIGQRNVIGIAIRNLAEG